MMDFELISTEEYASLPDDPEQKFFVLEAICRRHMYSMLSNAGNYAYDLIRLQYMATVAVAARELGIEEFRFPVYTAEFDHSEFNNFLLQAGAVTTRIRIRTSPDAFSVRLAGGTRAQIEREIQRLRAIVTGADISDDLRKKLLDRLEELSVELSSPRVSFARVMAVLAVIGIGLTQTTGLLADAPEAIATIASLLGADKEAENAEVLRLGPPPRPRSLPSPAKAASGAVDDEIPF